MTVLVHVEVADGHPDAEALGVLSAARAAGLEPVAVVVGVDASSSVGPVNRYGPSEIVVVEGAALGGAAALPRALALAEVMREYPGGGRLLAPTTTLTTEVAAVLSARTGAGLAWGLVDVRLDAGEVVVVRSAAGDTVLADIGWTTAWGIGLFRSHAFDPVEVDGGAVLTRVVDAPAGDDRGVETVEIPRGDDDGGERLDQAQIVVAGGRGLRRRDDLDRLRELARLLGGVAGVSLPLVELGWAPRSMQVGQTGTIVAPLLYVACGISGQIQHRVGMERSGTIVAINTDPAAPIMSWCDLAVVGDAVEIVDALIRELSPPS